MKRARVKVNLTIVGQDRENESGEDDSNGDVEDQSQTAVEEHYKEDIYGRIRDESGNVIEKTGSYVPPGKRLEIAKTTDQKKKIELERMNKKLKGLINR